MLSDLPFSMLNHSKRKQAKGMSVTPFIAKTVLREMTVILVSDSTIYWAFLAFLPLRYSLILLLFPQN